MVLYLSIISISAIILCAFDIPFALGLLQCDWWFVIVAVLIGIAYEITIDAIFFIFIEKSPNKWYSPDKKFFEVGKTERKFLEKTKIKKWKDYIWELGGLGGFSKRKIADPKSLEYIETFLIEINKGVVIHWAGIFVGFTLLLVFPFRYILPITLPIAIVNMVLNIFPILALRYNYPKMMTIRKKLLRDKAKEASLATEISDEKQKD